MWTVWLFIRWGKQFEETFENTVQKSQTNATGVTLHWLRQTIWGFMTSWIQRLPERHYITLHWLRQTFLLSVWSIVHFWDFSNVSLKLLFNRMHIYSSCICLIFPCCFLDSNACSQVCTQIACLGRCKITLVEFFPTALCLSSASSNHLSERISIHTDCTSVTTVYNYIVQPCVSPNASSNCLPRRCIITLIASFDVFIDKSFKTKYFTKCPSHENYFRLMLHILKRCILSTPGRYTQFLV